MTPTATEPLLHHATSVDGTEIAYFTTGTGPPLLLVHGLLGDHTRWNALRPHLEPHFTVHAIDRRGRGASGDAPQYAVEREFEDVAAVVEAVAAAAGGDVDVLGSSGGASYSVGAAALASSIRRLVLFEPPTGEVVRLLQPGLQERLEALLAAGEREALLVTAYRAVAGLSDEQIEHLRSQPEWPNRLAAAHTVPRELGVPADELFDPERARAVTAPTLVLIGGDTPDGYKASAKRVGATLPSAVVTVLDGQGHGAELFAPDVVAEHVLAFLREPG